jgi:hypothetical protein
MRNIEREQRRRLNERLKQRASSRITLAGKRR